MIKLTKFIENDFDDLISWITDAELLFTIAGNDLAFPLTREQLQSYLEDEKSHSFTIVSETENKKIGHAELQNSGGGLFKIDKVLIADKSMRGKGIGEQTINLLTEFAFKNLSAETVELYVFDWNESAVRCYEKCGFGFNPDKTKTLKINGKTQTAVNMFIKNPT